MPLTDQAKPAKLTPTVYFRGINRIHINRFKAYTQIMANQLTNEWSITDDPTLANVVIEQRAHASDEKIMQLSVLADTANHQPTVLWRCDLSFNESQLVRQLNLAWQKLRHGFAGTQTTSSPDRTFEVCDLTSSSQDWVARLRTLSDTIEFTAVIDLTEWQNDLFHPQVMLLVDPKNPASSEHCLSVLSAMQLGDLIIEQLIVVITDDGQAGEDLFDLVYAQADETTQITTLDPSDAKQWQAFVQFL